ncbi:hypothetical protein GCM10018785_72190 [Streptomyces longispororuber]|uniref:Histidine kinase n=1 Tax=Streptomyces longispororuber TaxID=68230 RepID=A0A919AB62_9ACTN|nr:toxin-antitoxin system HicB family antitoxin [Streptomyces longispororuber]GHE97146.1 hypothetical protein GCM10018785_72190 [Streptomyces longispororuber]
MELGRYVDDLRRELITAAGAGDPRTRELVARLAAPLSPAIRMVLLDVLAAAADEISRELAPGTVELRMRGREPDFAVTPPPAEDRPGHAVAPLPGPPVVPPLPPVPPTAPVDRDGAVARVNFRTSEELKAQIEVAADHEGLSVNTWLVRAASAVLNHEEQAARPARGAPHGGREYHGWVR